MKLRMFYSDPFDDDTVVILEEEDHGDITDIVREIFEQRSDVYKVSLNSNDPFYLSYERLPPEEKEEKENKDSSVVYPEFSSEEDEEEITKEEYGNWWD